MKKLTFTLALVTLLLSLTACTPPGAGEVPTDTEPPSSESATEALTEARTESGTEFPGAMDVYPNSQGYRLISALTLEGEPTYEGKLREELTEDFERVHGYGPIPRDGATQIILPTGVIYDMPMAGGDYYYDKQTGRIGSICPDALCDHTLCRWGSQQVQFQYVSEEYLYFTAKNHRNEDVLYRCDHKRRNVETLYQSTNSNDRIDSVWLEKDNLIYFVNVFSGQYCFGALNLDTRQLQIFSPRGELDILAVVDETVWYLDNFRDEGPIYQTDLSFSESRAVFSDFYKATYILNVGKETFHLCYTDDAYRPFASYNFVTGEATLFPAPVAEVGHLSPLCYDEQYVYYRKDLSEEEIAASPLRAFYEYRVLRDNVASIPEEYAERRYYYGKKDGGRLYRMNLTTGEEELVMEMSYNGVPISILNCVPDGNMLHIQYVTYRDYNNYYNPDSKPFGQLGGYETYHFGTLDMATGEWTQINP